MSNYIKIEMEDGKALSGSQTLTGGGTIAGYDARNGVEIFTSTGEGSGATCNITMGPRQLDPASAVLTNPASYGTGGVTGWNTNAATATGLAAQSGGATFNITTDGAQNITNVVVNNPGLGGGYAVNDVITIDVPTASGINNSGSDQTIVIIPLVDSDLDAPVITDLVFTVVDGGTGYANGDVLFLDIQASGPANEVSWSAIIEITVSGLTGYDDGPFALVPIDNAWMCGVLNGSNELGPMTGSGIAVFYQEADINNKSGGYPGLKVCNITFSGVSTAAQRKIIMENMNSIILQASAAENSQPYLTMPAGVKGVEVSFG